jgi:hypothetical protein
VPPGLATQTDALVVSETLPAQGAGKIETGRNSNVHDVSTVHWHARLQGVHLAGNGPF